MLSTHTATLPVREWGRFLLRQPHMLPIPEGGLHHNSPGQVPGMSPCQALQYFGDAADSQSLPSVRSNTPQSFDMIDALPVDQRVYPGMPLDEDCNGTLKDGDELVSAQEPVSFCQLAPKWEAVGSMEEDRIVSPKEPAEVAMMHAKGSNWYPAEHVQYQSTKDFKEDMLRNCHIPINERTFADWVWPPSERGAQKTHRQDNVSWATDARFDSPCDLTCRMSESKSGVRQMTQFGLETIREDEHSGSESPYPSLSSVSQAESSSIRARSRQPARDKMAPKKRYTRSVVGPSTERPIATSEDKRQREKLTIEQKRRNHIRHEKKRRALIRDGFNDLTELIPELRGRTLSRSTILFKAVDWLENLIRENEALIAQVSALESEKASLGSAAEAATYQSSQKTSNHTP